MMKIKKTVTDNLDRTELCEGRDQGIGFAMLKKLDNINFETVNPISPCKDYLAEVIFTENYKIPTKAHGLNYTKIKDILNEDVSYLVFKNLTTDGVIGHFNIEKKNFKQYSEEVLNGYKKIEAFINQFQSELENKFIKCKIEVVNDDQFLVIFDTQWACSTYSISLFSLLIRIGKDYVKKMLVLEYIKSIPNNSIDYSLLKTAIENIEKILILKRLPKTSKNTLEQVENKKNICPHNEGICAWQSEYE